MKYLALCLLMLAAGVRAGEVNTAGSAVGIGDSDDNPQTDRFEGASPTGGAKRQQGSPNIVFIMADDLGWNDIGYHNPEVISPVLDDLALNGRILTNNYVPPVCTPSRHALMSGKHPYASTMQHGVLTGMTPHCSPLDLDFLPKRLKALGYETAIAGKWHLGYCKQECTPMERGFDHQFGLMHGMGGFYTHDLQGYYDFRDNMVTDWSLSGSYTTDLLRNRAVSHIANIDNPLFMFVAFTAVHTPLEVPQKYFDMYPNVERHARQKYLAMMTCMDDAVGEIVQTLKDAGKWDNTLLIFSSDNGGESGGHADNYPLRGCKASLWEGGSRVIGFVNGGLINNVPQANDGLFHSVDWMPTLLHLATGGPMTDASMDGVDQYDMIVNGAKSARDEIVYNIDMENEPIFGQAAIRVGDYKLIWGHEGYCDGWGIDVTNFWLVEEQCQYAGLEHCPADSTAHRRRRGSYNYSPEEVEAQGLISESKRFDVNDIESGLSHLYNIAADPYEQTDLAGDPAYADIMADLKQRIIDKVNNEYKGPPSSYYEIRAQQAMAVMETNPDDPAAKGWGIGFCDDLDLLMP